MSVLRKIASVCLMVLLALVLTPASALGYFLLGSSVTPDTNVEPGDTVLISYTVGDPGVPDLTDGPYEVEIYYCNAADADSCFKCGHEFQYPPHGSYSGYHWPLWVGGWADRFDDYVDVGTIHGLIGTASHYGALIDDTFVMPWTVPADLPEGTYNIHILVGYSSECLNWTHYNLQIETTGGGPVPGELSVKKYVDFTDANSADPPVFADFTDDWEKGVAGTASWLVAVTNTGGSNLTNVTVTDDKAPAGHYPLIPLLAPSQTVTFTAYTTYEDKDTTNTAVANGFTEDGEPVPEARDSAWVFVETPPGPKVTSWITDTNAGFSDPTYGDLSTMYWAYKGGKFSTNPGGCMYWVQVTAAQAGSWTIVVNPVSPYDDFVFQGGGSPISVSVNGGKPQNQTSTTWTGTVPANSTILLRAHYKYAPLMQRTSPLDYTFSATANGMYTSDILTLIKK